MRQCLRFQVLRASEIFVLRALGLRYLSNLMNNQTYKYMTTGLGLPCRGCIALAFFLASRPLGPVTCVRPPAMGQYQHH